jgi:hypothetical protein
MDTPIYWRLVNELGDPMFYAAAIASWVESSSRYMHLRIEVVQ